MSQYYRTAYDKQLSEQWGLKEGYNSQPFPGDRTKADRDLQKQWCKGGCDGKIKEGFAPLYGFRTTFDNEIQKQWCCGNKACDCKVAKPYESYRSL